jgi:hypothetical protein
VLALLRDARTPSGNAGHQPPWLAVRSRVRGRAMTATATLARLGGSLRVRPVSSPPLSAGVRRWPPLVARPAATDRRAPLAVAL